MFTQVWSWNADLPGQRVSYLHDATLDDAGCLDLSDQKLLRVDRLDITGCTGALMLSNSDVNVTGTDLTALAINGASIDLSDASTLHLSNSPVSPFTSINIDATSMIEEAWPVEVWVRNLVENGVPFASVDLSFTAVAPARALATDVNGHMVLDDAIARVSTPTGLPRTGTSTSRAPMMGSPPASKCSSMTRRPCTVTYLCPTSRRS